MSFRQLCLLAAVFAAAGSALMQPGQRAAAAEPPHIFYSWTLSNAAPMQRCGDLQWQGRVCGIAGAPTDADRDAVRQRWLRQGFDPKAVTRAIDYWAHRVRDRRSNGDVDLRDEEKRQTPYRKLTTPQACAAVRQVMARATAACRAAVLLCDGKPCDNANLPRRLPGEIIVPTGTALGDCGEAQAAYEQCGIKGGVSAATRKAAEAGMIRQGFHPADVAEIFSVWDDAYEGRKKEKGKPGAGICASFAKPAEKRNYAARCGTVFPECTQYGYSADCMHFRTWRKR